jgi:hypothetical protein
VARVCEYIVSDFYYQLTSKQPGSCREIYSVRCLDSNPNHVPMFELLNDLLVFMVMF